MIGLLWRAGRWLHGIARARDAWRAESFRASGAFFRCVLRTKHTLLSWQRLQAVLTLTDQACFCRSHLHRQSRIWSHQLTSEPKGLVCKKLAMPGPCPAPQAPLALRCLWHCPASKRNGCRTETGDRAYPVGQPSFMFLHVHFMFFHVLSCSFTHIRCDESQHTAMEQSLHCANLCLLRLALWRARPRRARLSSHPVGLRSVGLSGLGGLTSTDNLQDVVKDEGATAQLLVI